MRPGPLLIAALVLAGAAVCVKLGLWQLTRYHEKRAALATIESAMAAPPAEVSAETSPAAIENHRVRLRGSFDPRVHILLAGRERNGAAGVHVVTPFVLEPRPGSADSPSQSPTAVLVDRGWLPADDAITARPQDTPEPDRHDLTGVARAMTKAPAGYPWRRLATEPDPVTLWSALLLDPDSIAARLPYPVAPFFVTELPGVGVPAQPARSAPEMPGASTHLSYAIQWFLFASILTLGPAFFAFSRRRAAAIASR